LQREAILLDGGQYHLLVVPEFRGRDLERDARRCHRLHYRRPVALHL
jgi:hypothetical protein